MKLEFFDQTQGFLNFLGYSKVPNKRAVSNKRDMGKFFENKINEQSLINETWAKFSKKNKRAVSNRRVAHNKRVKANFLKS